MRHDSRIPAPPQSPAPVGHDAAIIISRQARTPMKIPLSPPTVEIGGIERLSRRLADPAPNGRYLHWDELRHRPPPPGLSVEDWFLGQDRSTPALPASPDCRQDRNPFSSWRDCCPGCRLTRPRIRKGRCWCWQMPDRPSLPVSPAGFLCAVGLARVVRESTPTLLTRSQTLRAPSRASEISVLTA